MTAQFVFVDFVKRSLAPARAARYAELSGSPKGRSKILDLLCHDFHSSLRPDLVKPMKEFRAWGQPCYLFQGAIGFGVDGATVRQSYQALSATDGWLILLVDGSEAIHRPEDRWDDEILISPGGL